MQAVLDTLFKCLCHFGSQIKTNKKSASRKLFSQDIGVNAAALVQCLFNLAQTLEEIVGHNQSIGSGTGSRAFGLHAALVPSIYFHTCMVTKGNIWGQISDAVQLQVKNIILAFAGPQCLILLAFSKPSCVHHHR